jgi:hypothetical protein
MKCEIGLLFDSITNKCVKPELSDCKCSNTEKIPSADGCNIYWHCQNGTYIGLWCPKLLGVQVFDPQTRQCVANKKLPTGGKCSRSFKECLNVTNKHEVWTVSECGPSLYFDSAKQTCVDMAVCED